MRRVATSLAISLFLASGAHALGTTAPAPAAPSTPVQYGGQQDWNAYVNGRQVRPYRGEEPRTPPAYGRGYGSGYGSGTTNVIVAPQTTIIVPDTRSFNEKYGFSSSPR